MHTKYRNELKFKKLPILYKLISSLKMATHVHSSSQKLHSSYARIIIACICGTWTACCIHFTSILLAILRKHIRYNGVRLIKLIQVRRNNLCQHDIFGTFLKSIWRCNTIYSYFGQNLFFISYNRYYQFLWQSPASENSIPWKEKKYVLKHPQNINRSECIMKCALESTSTKHCSFISATPVHTFTDADLPEPCTDPHIKPTKNSSEMIWIGFCKSYEKEAKHCKTC